VSHAPSCNLLIPYSLLLTVAVAVSDAASTAGGLPPLPFVVLTPALASLDRSDLGDDLAGDLSVASADSRVVSSLRALRSSTRTPCRVERFAGGCVSVSTASLRA
jgi:hypothetical protein